MKFYLKILLMYHALFSNCRKITKRAKKLGFDEYQTAGFVHKTKIWFTTCLIFLIPFIPYVCLLAQKYFGLNMPLISVENESLLFFGYSLTNQDAEIIIQFGAIVLFLFFAFIYSLTWICFEERKVRHPGLNDADNYI